MTNPATVLGVTGGIQQLMGAAYKSGLDHRTLELVHLRVSQINGCSYCVFAGSRKARSDGETDERLTAVAAWREAPFFTDAERAALALAEAATRLADRSDPVPDEIWNEAAAHFEENQLAGLMLAIGMSNLFNRLNVPVRQPVDTSW